MQVVDYNGKVSEQSEISIGVPQGTILGPLLFLLYLNDLSHVINNASINIYAGYVVIYMSNSSFSDLKGICTSQTSKYVFGVFTYLSYRFHTHT